MVPHDSSILDHGKCTLTSFLIKVWEFKTSMTWRKVNI